MNLYERIVLAEGELSEDAGYIGKSIGRAIADIRVAKGGLYYRLYGDGSYDRGKKKDVLSDQDKKKAEKAYQALGKAEKLALDASQSLRHAKLGFN